jgi:hypothetical protein
LREEDDSGASLRDDIAEVLSNLFLLWLSEPILSAFFILAAIEKKAGGADEV